MASYRETFRLRKDFKTCMVPIVKILDAIPSAFDRCVEDTETKIYRAVQLGELGRSVTIADRVRKSTVLGPGRQIGVVIAVASDDNGPVALLGLYRACGPVEMMIESDVPVKSVELSSFNSRARSIFDFTQD